MDIKLHCVRWARFYCRKCKTLLKGFTAIHLITLQIFDLIKAKNGAQKPRCLIDHPHYGTWELEYAITIIPWRTFCRTARYVAHYAVLSCILGTQLHYSQPVSLWQPYYNGAQTCNSGGLNYIDFSIMLATVVHVSLLCQLLLMTSTTPSFSMNVDAIASPANNVCIVAPHIYL